MWTAPRERAEMRCQWAVGRASAGTTTVSPGIGTARTIHGGRWTLPMIVMVFPPERAGMLLARRFMSANERAPNLISSCGAGTW
jgi:hypothetical protein